jgi:hypothetical protein
VSKGANGLSQVVAPATTRGENENGPREGLLPSGQAAGRWYFPPPLCADDSKARHQRSSSTHISAYVQRLNRARHEQTSGN